MKIKKLVLILIIIVIPSYFGFLPYGFYVVPEPKIYNFLWAILIPSTAAFIALEALLIFLYLHLGRKSNLSAAFTDGATDIEIKPHSFDISKLVEEKNLAKQNQATISKFMALTAGNSNANIINSIEEEINTYKNKELLPLSFKISNSSRTDAEKVELRVAFPDDFGLYEEKHQPEFVGSPMDSMLNINRFNIPIVDSNAPLVDGQTVYLNTRIIRGEDKFITEDIFVKPPELEHEQTFTLTYKLCCTTGALKRGKLEMHVKPCKKEVVRPLDKNQDSGPEG